MTLTPFFRTARHNTEAVRARIAQSATPNQRTQRAGFHGIQGTHVARIDFEGGREMRSDYAIEEIDDKTSCIVKVIYIQDPSVFEGIIGREIGDVEHYERIELDNPELAEVRSRLGMRRPSPSSKGRLRKTGPLDDLVLQRGDPGRARAVSRRTRPLFSVFRSPCCRSPGAPMRAMRAMPPWDLFPQRGQFPLYNLSM